MAIGAFVAGGLWTALASFLAVGLPVLVTRLLLGLGIGIATYQGAELVLDDIEAYVTTKFGDIAGVPDLGTTMVQVAGALNLDIAATMLISAYGYRVALLASRVFLTKLAPGS